MSDTQSCGIIRRAMHEDADGIALILRDLWRENFEVDAFHAHIASKTSISCLWKL